LRQSQDELRQGDCPTWEDAHQGELVGLQVDEELLHPQLMRRDYYQRAVDGELHPLPVLGLVLQKDYCQDAVALAARYRLQVHRQVVSLLERQALPAQRADEELQIQEPLIPRKFLIDFSCSHRAAR